MLDDVTEIEAMSKFATHITDDDEPGYCPHCSGSGEGSHDGAICGYCKGSGVERDDSGKEDYEADRADQINDERKLAGEWE